MGIDRLTALLGSRTGSTGSLRGLLAACCGLVLAGSASAQAPGSGCETPHLLSGPGVQDVRVDPRGRLCAWTPLPASRPDSVDGEPSGPGAATVFAASLVLPGGGQWLRGQSRTYLYSAVELLGWAAFAQGRFEGTDLRNRYRDLAWRVARNAEGVRRPEADFGYYETLAEYQASGAWDRDPTRSGLQPETDSDTYNGSVWSLARELYSLTDARSEMDSRAHARALEYYREHSYPPELAWDWSQHPDAAKRYRHFIKESDDAFRRATIVLAVIATNHVLSAVDGFLSARIGSGPAGEAASARALHPDLRSRNPWRLELRLGGHR